MKVNKYGGQCFRCNLRVPAGFGVFRKTGKYQDLFHEECAVKMFQDWCTNGVKKDHKTHDPLL